MYSITLAPRDGVLHGARAILEDGAIVLEASVSKEGDGQYQYLTRSRVGIYSEPSQHCLVGILPAGHTVSGSAPSRQGWIRLDEDEWIVDDGSLALVGRPSASRASPFSKRVELPSDADLRRAASESLRNGGLLVTVPRIRRQPAPAKQVPVSVARPSPRAAPRQPAAAAAAKRPAEGQAPAASKAAPAAPKTRQQPQQRHESAEEMKVRHKREAAERRDALGRLVGSDYDGPVLTECAAFEVSTRNVQSPTEEVEEWVATANGGFARGHGSVIEVTDQQMASSSSEEEEELAYWGF